MHKKSAKLYHKIAGEEVAVRLHRLRQHNGVGGQLEFGRLRRQQLRRQRQVHRVHGPVQFAHLAQVLDDALHFDDEAAVGLHDDRVAGGARRRTDRQLDRGALQHLEEVARYADGHLHQHRQLGEHELGVPMRDGLLARLFGGQRFGELGVDLAADGEQVFGLRVGAGRRHGWRLGRRHKANRFDRVAEDGARVLRSGNDRVVILAVFAFLHSLQ